jgi:outer membrane protein assembly factor BamB
VNGDHDGDSYIIALSREDGHIVWKTPREHHTRSYCVPIIRELSGRTQMVLSGDKSVASYDPNNGKLHWIMDGPTEQFVASIVYNPKGDLLFVTGGFPDLHILGLKHDGHGKIDDSKIAWRSTKGVSYVPSPISVGDYFFIVSDGGIGTCFEAKSGKIMWQERLGGGHHPSLVAAENHVYFLSDTGLTTVVEAKPEFTIIAKNDLGEKCFASPAITDGQIFIRSDKHLVCIGQPKS